jgi:exodeoxyribonuclease VII small subunit
LTRDIEYDNGQGSFEDGVKRLEEVVRQLEQPTVTLDVALELFGEGVALVRQCQARLSQAEEKMAVLLEGPDGSLSLAESDDTVE